MRSSYFHNGQFLYHSDSDTGKMASLYWNSPLFLILIPPSVSYNNNPCLACPDLMWLEGRLPLIAGWQHQLFVKYRWK